MQKIFKRYIFLWLTLLTVSVNPVSLISSLPTGNIELVSKADAQVLTKNTNLTGVTTWVQTTLTRATYNPSDKSANVTLSNGNLTAARNAGIGIVRATIGVTGGKWYWEVTINTPGDCYIGIADNLSVLTGNLGATVNQWSTVCDDGGKWHIGNQGVYGTAYLANDILSFLLDMDAGTITVWRNGSTLGTMFTDVVGRVFPAFGSQLNTAQVTANFGATAFTYTPPGGYNSGIYNYQ